MDDLSRQIEEMEALISIYGDEWKADSLEERSYTIDIKENDHTVMLCVTLPLDYPSKRPPAFEFSAPWMDRGTKDDMRKALLDVYLETPGETVIYQWIEKIRDEMQNLKKVHRPSFNGHQHADTAQETIEAQSETDACPEIIHGDPIVDRKSTFQGHAAVVYSLGDVKAVLRKLKTNKKIMNATHNMYAYRFDRQVGTGTSVIQDCDDDGENHAGSRMLHLLQILEQKNALVVVTRWYGGIQLGPDRFRHINNAARQVLVQAGLVKT